MIEKKKGKKLGLIKQETSTAQDSLKLPRISDRHLQVEPLMSAKFRD